MEKHIREKMQEASFGHVKLEMLRKLSEKCIWRSSLPLEVQAPASDASFWLNQKNLKFNISELNVFIPLQICNFSCVHQLGKRYHHSTRLQPDPWGSSGSAPNTARESIAQPVSLPFPCPHVRTWAAPTRLSGFGLGISSTNLPFRLSITKYFCSTPGFFCHSPSYAVIGLPLFFSVICTGLPESRGLFFKAWLIVTATKFLLSE